MDILYQNLAKILKRNHSNLFLSGFLARYPNSESRFEKLVKFYTKAMLRFFIIGKLLEKYDPEQSGGTGHFRSAAGMDDVDFWMSSHTYMIYR